MNCLLSETHFFFSHGKESLQLSAWFRDVINSTGNTIFLCFKDSPRVRTSFTKDITQVNMNQIIFLSHQGTCLSMSIILLSPKIVVLTFLGL